jgi:hypothetical protein
MPSSLISHLNTPSLQSFGLHVGGMISIPSKDAQARPQYTHYQPYTAGAPLPDGVTDPFEGLPFRAFAEKMGDRIVPVVQAAREDHRRAVKEGRAAADAAQPAAITVPHLLPFTRWAAQSETFKATFVVEGPDAHKKARLSWYHPDDTMVPRGWFSQGLMADLKYYMPFGLGGSAAAAANVQAQ